jgi:TolB-like protein
MKGDNAVQPRGDGHEIFVGRRVGPYEVQSHLGTGGMGSVFRARDTKLGRDVALKILPDRWLADPERRARFNREARVLAALNHPHIAAIYDLEDGDGIRALVLELVEGPTLAERLSEGPLPSTNALRMGAQVADALAAAHARGIIHRDLKPANIKLTADGRVKVLDFGLAKANAIMDNGPLDLSHPATVVRATQEGILLGTVGYMSPEQARGRMVDERTDIWAFGCVLYEMLTGRQAFEGDTFPDAVAAILTRDPDWARLPSALPAEVRALLHQCLEKEPDRRIRDISTVASQLTDSQKLPARQAPSKLVGIAVTILLVFLAGIYFRRAIIRGPVELARSTRSGPAAVLAPSFPAPKPRRAVAVLGFRNLSPRQGSAWVSDALAEMLTSELTAGEQLRMIPGETIARMKIDLELADAESYARETLDRIRVNLGTDLVVLGSYVTIGQRIRLDLRVQNTAEGAASIVVSEPAAKASCSTSCPARARVFVNASGLASSRRLRPASCKRDCPPTPQRCGSIRKAWPGCGCSTP